jgi:hypothetical protein
MGAEAEDKGEPGLPSKTLFPKNFFKERMKETCIMTFMKPEGLLLS